MPQYYSLSLYGQKMWSKWMLSFCITSPFVFHWRMSDRFETTWGCVFLSEQLFNMYVAFQISSCVHTKIFNPSGSSVRNGQIYLDYFQLGLYLTLYWLLTLVLFLVLTAQQVMQVHPQHPHLHQVNFYFTLSCMSFCPVIPKSFT